MALAIHLLGRPHLERDGEPVARPRGHKAWGLVAYLLLSRVRNPSRERLAELLFTGADDPLGSLRWNLAELRRALGAATLPHGSTELALPPGTFVDVDALIRGTPQEAVAIPGLGRELLEGMEFGNSPAFETWLLIERRRLLGAAEAALHEASLDRLAAGEAAAAVGLAARLVELNPYDENFQELLVRSYAETGDREAANRQVSACLELFRAEHGRAPGTAVFRAAEARPPARVPAAGPAGKQAARARLEAGRSAINAGSFDPGVRSLARAAAEAKACGAHELEAESWLALGTALVHSARGRDEEGADALLRATSLAEERGLGDVAAAAHRELAYVDILQARYARCAQRLERAGALAESDEERAGVEAMLGLAAADTGAHERALAHLRRSVELAERAGSRQQASFSLSFVGRSHFLREELDDARAALERSLALARESKWVAFEPWPESWLAEADLAGGELPAGRERFEHAWALASELGDPCWEGAAGQGLGRLACLEGRVPTGLRLLEEARRRAGSFPDAYVWVEAYALAELASAAVEAGHRRARQWVEDLTSLTARTGMRELAVRAYVLRADLGDRNSLDSAAILVAEVENPALRGRIQGLRAAVAA
ncbi:MAG: BTAD domain-containing putative transcriptional regulator [Thermoleophilaceae bacterium]